jgi:PTH1 family peptidyl-tRNA hydrolase
MSTEDATNLTNLGNTPQKHNPTSSAGRSSALFAGMIAGLGNPGLEYARNRHNIGFQVVELFAERHDLRFDKYHKRARLAIGRIVLRDSATLQVLLAKPLTYMNTSGESLGALAAFYRVVPEHILVVHDDLDLPLGRIRLRAGGSSGGQKGVQSIIEHLGTETFPRLRIGIGRPPGQMDPAAYVLQPFSAEQESEMAFVRPRAADAIEVWLTQGIEVAMNQFNSTNDGPAPLVRVPPSGQAAPARQAGFRS